jgi:hypothetical protein
MTERLLAAVCVTLLSACGSLHGERPAVIAEPTAATRTELSRAVTLAFDGVPVTLSDSAFTRESVLSVDRRAPPGPQGRVATGLTLEQPARLRLVLRGSRCELVRERDGQRFPLRDVSCVPLEPGR